MSLHAVDMHRDIPKSVPGFQDCAGRKPKEWSKSNSSLQRNAELQSVRTELR